jgi:hypothetical protein
MRLFLILIIITISKFTFGQNNNSNENPELLNIQTITNFKNPGKIDISSQINLINEWNINYEKGINAIKNNQINSALAFFQKCKQLIPENKYASAVDDKINWCNKKLKQTGFNGFGIMYNSMAPFGIYAASLHPQKIKTYWNFRMHSAFLNAYDSLNLTDDKLLFYPEDVVKGLLSTGFGLTKKIFYPVWVFAGLNVGLHRNIETGDLFLRKGDASSSFAFERRYRYISKGLNPGISIFPEMGIEIKIKRGVSFRYGFLFGEWNKGQRHQFGLIFTAGQVTHKVN